MGRLGENNCGGLGRMGKLVGGRYLDWEVKKWFRVLLWGDNETGEL